MAADAHHIGLDLGRDERTGWLLRKLKPGERATLSGGIIIELRKTDRGQIRLAISAPASVVVAFGPAQPGT